MDECKLTKKNYSRYLRDFLFSLKATGQYADVTLVSDDQVKLKCHKFILNIISPVLRNVLSSKAHEDHSFIFLTGIEHPEIESILEFFYFGQTICKPKRIELLIEAANILGIKELCQNLENKNNDRLSQNFKSSKNDIPTPTKHSQNPRLNAPIKDDFKLDDPFFVNPVSADMNNSESPFNNVPDTALDKSSLKISNIKNDVIQKSFLTIDCHESQGNKTIGEYSEMLEEAPSISQSSMLQCKKDLMECQICHIVFDSKKVEEHVMSHQKSKKNLRIKKKKSKVNKLKKKKICETKSIHVKEIDEEYVPDEEFVADDEYIDDVDEEMFDVVDKGK